jgi:hypothetical protein
MTSRSLPSLQQVLAWATEQGMTVRDQLSEEQLAALERAFAGKEPWRLELYPALRAFGYALSRLSLPDLPALLNVGDVLVALDELRAPTVPAWSTREGVAETTFAELGYASTSAAITRARDANAAAWREHALNNKQLLLRGAERATGGRAVVVGAGKLYDIPLRKLAERFEQLVLVDIDAAALADSVKQVGLEPRLNARLSLVRADVTGINDVFLEKAREALALTDEAEVHAALLRLLQDFRLEEPPRLFPESAVDGPLDFACSSMVLSQLATPFTHCVQERFAQRFPSSARAREPEFQTALGQFAHRVQMAHIRSLLAAAPCVALTTDTLDRATALDGRGNLVYTTPPLPLLASPVLPFLVPRLEANLIFAAEWQWGHVVPTPRKPRGRTVQVAGVIAERSSR